MTKFRIVVVDDVEDLRALVRLLLESTGQFEVVGEGGTGVEAVEAARTQQPDLILLDMSMPDMDGLEALPLLREAAPWAKVVVLSGFERERLWPLAAENGAIAYIEKGTPGPELVNQLLAIAGVLELADSALAEARSRMKGEPVSPRHARRFVDETLRHWDCGADLDLVELLVSELVTNAVIHAKSDVEVVVQMTPRNTLRVEVIDQSDAMPIVRTPEAADSSGRGLGLVETLASDWGVDSRGSGKVVWFEVPRFDQGPEHALEAEAGRGLGLEPPPTSKPRNPS